MLSQLRLRNLFAVTQVAMMGLMLQSCSTLLSREPNAKRKEKIGFGWEPTLTNREILNVDVDLKDSNGETYHWEIEIPENAKYRDLVKERLEEICKTKKCVISESQNKHGNLGWKVTYPNKKWFIITPDPSVVEFIVGNNTLEDFQKNAKIFQDDIFDVAREVGLKPHMNEGQGHISIFSKLFEDPKYLRNFLVDMANHPELGLGIFDYNLADAPPIGVSKAKARSFGEVIEKFDRGELSTTEELIGAIEQDVYALHDTHPERNEADHAQMLRLYELNNSDRAAKRLEVRTFRPQKDFKEFLLQIELFEARMRYLEEFTGLIEYQEISKPSVEVAIKNFKSFVVDSGLDWKSYKVFVPEKWSQNPKSQKACTEGLKLFTQHQMVFR